jgi:hypothetical protein
MPRKWVSSWPLSADSGGESARDRLIHTFGNLTLLTGRLNSKVSNGPWLGEGGKRQALEAHDVLLLNRAILKLGRVGWTDESIRARTRELTQVIIDVWPVPPGHRSGFLASTPKLRKKVGLSDLIAAGVLQPGVSLFPRRTKHASRVVTLLPDGQVEVDGRTFHSPSDAASSITGYPTNGWWFFLVDRAAKRALKNVRTEYIQAMAVDAEDDEAEGDDEDDEA